MFFFRTNLPHKSLSAKKFIFGFSLFTLLSILIGTLVVCFTAFKHSIQLFYIFNLYDYNHFCLDEICLRSFKRTVNDAIQYDSQPRSLAIGDFNQDNNLDVVVANSGEDDIGIFFGYYNGSFSKQIIYSTGDQSNPYSVVVNHFNQDNYLDIAVANYGTHTIGVFFGKENGTFDNQTTFSTDIAHPLYLSSADLNNDTKHDIIVVNYGTNDISIYFGDGDGRFENKTSYSNGYDSIPYSLVIADFNHDNYLDIAVANYGTNNIQIYIGYGNGSFISFIRYTTTPYSYPCSITITDLNNDNHLDLIVANSGSKNIGLFYGYGNGLFTSQEIYNPSTITIPQYVTTGDVNNDNQSDIIIVDSINSYVHILPAYPNGTFFNLTTYITGAETFPYAAVIGDFNHDNQLDIGVVNYGTNELLILIKYSTVYTATQTRFPVGRNSDPQSLAIGDFNNDACLDIVVPQYTADGIAILLGDGNGSFATNISYTITSGSGPYSICTGDYNNDNNTDIAVANYGSSTIGILFGYGNGSLSSMITYSTGYQTFPIFITTDDFNNDNILDLVVANFRIDNVGVFLGYRNGTFANFVTYSTGIGSDPTAITIGDFNNDTHLDLAVANSENSNIGILFGNGDGTFDKVITYSTGFESHPDSIVSGDLNNDHLLDIIIADSSSDYVAVLYGSLNGIFNKPILYTDASFANPSGLALGDVNYDNNLDIIITNFGTDNVAILTGNGNGSFSLGRLYSLVSGADPKDVVIADFNNDSRWDMAIVESGIGRVNLLVRYVAALFQNATTYTTGHDEHPHAITVGDFNNDNRSDIAVANSGTDNIGIYFGYGNGSFAPEKNYYVGLYSSPQYVTVGDFNQDHYLDIVTASPYYDGIIVLLGYGNSSFQDPTVYSTKQGSQPYWVATGDFNNNKRIDFVVANLGRDNIAILLNYNYNAFQDQQTYSNAYSLRPSSIIACDLNDDTYIDVVAAFAGYDSVGILYGYGNGSFNDIIMYSVGYQSYPYEIISVDINHDYILDIIVANAGSSTLGVLLGLGNRTFATVMLFFTGIESEPYSAASADFNNDTHIDIVTANYRGNSIGVLLGYGNGSFASVVIYSTVDGSRPQSVAVSDFNQDHILDIVVANYRRDNVGLFLGNGDGTFQHQIEFSTGNFSMPTFLIANDFNNDSINDVAVSNKNADNIGILYGYGNGTFRSIRTFTTGAGSSPQCIRSGDFNNDNILDISVASPGTNYIMILYGLRDGDFMLGPSYSTGQKSGTLSMGVGDFNNDDKLDIATANFLMDDIGIHMSYGYQPYGGVLAFSTGTGSSPCSVAVSDFNNDSNSDVVVANYGTNTVGILFGYGNGKFSNIITHSVGATARPIVVSVGDINNDNRSDIVVVNSQANNIYILMGLGNGTFSILPYYSTGYGSYPSAITIADYNNDNKMDIIIVTAGTNLVILAEGYGNGTFGNETSYAMGYNFNPYSVVVGDFNGDGWIDIAIANYGGDFVEILLQTC